jgi:hypothetical protein
MKNQIKKLKTELREFLELSNEATKGPWKIETCRTYCSDDEFTHNVIGPPSDFMYLQEKEDAAFIARSRNISPAIAECLLVVVERLDDMSFDLADALETQILTIWEALK